MVKESGTHTHMMNATHYKKKEIWSFMIPRMNLEDISLSEISQVQKQKHHINFTHVCNLKTLISEVENRTVFTEGGGG